MKSNHPFYDVLVKHKHTIHFMCLQIKQQVAKWFNGVLT